jgi:hypothetical protein
MVARPGNAQWQTHITERNDIAPGAAARVTLLAESTHLMPWAPLAETRAE